MLGTAITILLAAATSAEREPELLPHVGGWQIDYDQDACHLAAKFGDEKDRVIARFTRFTPMDGFDLMLIGKRLDTQSRIADVTVDFGLGKRKTTAMAGTAGTSRVVMISGIRIDGWLYPAGARMEDAPLVTPQQEATARTLTVGVDRKRPFQLALGSLEKPMAALRKCTTDLVRHWGFDPAEQATLRERPHARGSAANWLRSNDYPALAIRKRANGVVQVRMDIDAQGGATGCRVLFRTEPDVFADETCKILMKRASFTPAIDAAGAPVRSFYVYKINWQVPG